MPLDQRCVLIETAVRGCVSALAGRGGRGRRKGAGVKVGERPFRQPSPCHVYAVSLIDYANVSAILITLLARGVVVDSIGAWLRRMLK